MHQIAQICTYIMKLILEWR